jgi:hypothetical protein
VPLHTEFEVVLDGSLGDTYLNKCMSFLFHPPPAVS